MFSRLFPHTTNFFGPSDDGVLQQQSVDNKVELSPEITSELEKCSDKQEYAFIVDVLKKNMPINKCHLIDLDGVGDSSYRMYTALMLAARHNLPLVAQALLDLGADVNFTIAPQDLALHRTALGIAIEAKHPEIIALLLNQNGIDLNLIAEAGYDRVYNEYLLKKLELTYKDRGDDVTPFHMACSQLDLDLARTLFHKGARITVVPLILSLEKLMRLYDETDVSFETFQNQNLREFQMLDFLMKECIAVEHINTVLQYLQSENFRKPRQLSFIETIFSQYANNCLQNIQTGVPYSLLPTDISQLTVNLLLSLEEQEELSIDDIIDKDGDRLGNINEKHFIERVLRKYEDVNAVNSHEEERTALMMAAKHGRFAMVNQLLADGANVNAQDRFGRTALMYAIYGKHPKIIGKILETKDVNLELTVERNMEGHYCDRTAFEIAIEMLDLKTAQLLFNQGAENSIPQELVRNLFKTLIADRENPHKPYEQVMNNELKMLHFILGECIPGEALPIVREILQSEQRVPVRSQKRRDLFWMEKEQKIDVKAVRYIEEIISQYENRHVNAQKIADAAEPNQEHSNSPSIAMV